MKRIFSIFIFFVCFALYMGAQTDKYHSQVLLETDSGNIIIELYNETPKHRDNFLLQVKRGTYNGVLFHRVIKDFMIQTGDIASKMAKKGQLLGETPEEYNIPAEIKFPLLYHKRGAVAAARESNDVNPNRSSSSTQFYIVWGKKYNDKQLDRYQAQIDKSTNGKIKLTNDIRNVYSTLGGTPHLDGLYTVFGQVIEGLDVVEKIQNAICDSNDRPITDIKIKTARIIK